MATVAPTQKAQFTQAAAAVACCGVRDLCMVLISCTIGVEHHA